MYKKLPIAPVIAAMLFLQSSCITFYQVSSKDHRDKGTVNALNYYQARKYQFVLHAGELLWAINNVSLNDKTITGTYDELGTMEYYYYEKLSHGQKTGRVHYGDRRYIYQVHIYADKFAQNGGNVTIKEEDIQGVNVYDMNEVLTFVSYAGTAGLVSIGALGVFLAIVCNCPHVYTYDGETYHYTNTLFTGAVSPKLERNDYKIMPDYFPSSENYKFIVKNEDNEKQYASQLEMMVVQHQPDETALVDQKGEVYLVKNKVLPATVSNGALQNIYDLVAYPDDVPFTFDSKSDSALSYLYASFQVEDETESPGLILKLNNSKWGGYVYHEFSKLFGRYYDNWVRKNQKNSGEQMKQNMKEQGITMVVSVKEGNSWVDIEEIDLTGDVAYHTLFVPLAKRFVKNSQIEVRLSCGFKFWQLDYMALATNLVTNVKAEYPELKVADTFKKDGEAAVDKNYMLQLNQGDSAYFEFSGLKHVADMERTIFLRGKGYYISETRYKGKPQYADLKRFKQPGELSRFSWELYTRYFDNLAQNK